MEEPNLIECSCGSCILQLAENKPTLHLVCTCIDCRRSMDYLRSLGGSEPIYLPDVYYMQADILSVDGLENMIPFKIRDDGQAIRVYCEKCFSILGVYHPLMKNNVFANWPAFCVNRCDLKMPLKAYIFLDDYHGDLSAVRTDVPSFGTLNSREEFKNFMAIEEVSESFKERDHPLKGMSFIELIRNLRDVEIAFERNK